MGSFGKVLGKYSLFLQTPSLYSNFALRKQLVRPALVSTVITKKCKVMRCKHYPGMGCKHPHYSHYDCARCCATGGPTNPRYRFNTRSRYRVCIK